MQREYSIAIVKMMTKNETYKMDFDDVNDSLKDKNSSDNIRISTAFRGVGYTAKRTSIAI